MQKNDGVVKVDQFGAVAVLTLNRPTAINAINDDMRSELPTALMEADADPSVRVVVVHGSGERGFCVGADIKENREGESSIAARERLKRSRMFSAFGDIRKPTIAAVHGFCLGGGLEIALACDIRIASPDAVFGLPETGLGLIPGGGGTQRLPRIIGLGRALDLMLTGDRFKADEAYRIGVVSRVATDQQSLLPDAIQLAQRIADKPPVATMYAKEAACAGIELELKAGIALERNLFTLLLSTADRKEAAAAFREKRAPVFSGS